MFFYFSSYRKFGSVTLGGIIYVHDVSTKQDPKTAPLFLTKLWLMLNSELPIMHAKIAFATSNCDGQSKENCDDEAENMKEGDWKDLTSNGSEVFDFMDDDESAWKIVQKLASSPPVRIRLSSGSTLGPLKSFRACLDAIKTFSWKVCFAWACAAHSQGLRVYILVFRRPNAM